MNFSVRALEHTPAQLIWRTPYEDGAKNIGQALSRGNSLSLRQRGWYLIGGLCQCIPLVNSVTYCAIRILYSPDFWAQTPAWKLPGEWHIVVSDVRNTISETNLQALLDTCHISHRAIPPNEWTEPSPTKSPISRQMLTWKSILWSNETVQLDAVRLDGGYYLFMRLCSQTDFIHTTGQEIIPLNRSIERLAQIFKTAFGSDHYTESLTENGSDWAMQLFPSGNFGTSKAEEVDIHAKAQRNFFIFSQGQFGEAGLPFKMLQRLMNHLGPGMQSAYTPPDRSQRSPVIASQWINSGQAATSYTQLLLHSWQQSGLRVKHIPLLRKQTIPTIPKPLKETKVCAFCRDDVIQRQSLIEGKTMRLLYNHLPYVGREGEETSHLLLTTKDHLEVDAPSDEELIEEHGMVVLIKRVMEESRQNVRCVVMRQQGHKAGQSVFHRHVHVVVYKNEQMPELLELVPLEIADRPVPIVSQRSPKFVATFKSYAYPV